MYISHRFLFRSCIILIIVFSIFSFVIYKLLKVWIIDDDNDDDGIFLSTSIPK